MPHDEENVNKQNQMKLYPNIKVKRFFFVRVWKIVITRAQSYLIIALKMIL